MTERILGLIAVGTMVAGVAFAGYHYREVHIPEFQEIKGAVHYQACIQQCMETCKANGIPIDKCDCSHCNVYKTK